MPDAVTAALPLTQDEIAWEREQHQAALVGVGHLVCIASSHEESARWPCREARVLATLDAATKLYDGEHETLLRLIVEHPHAFKGYDSGCAACREMRDLLSLSLGYEAFPPEGDPHA